MFGYSRQFGVMLKVVRLLRLVAHEECVHAKASGGVDEGEGGNG